MGANGDGGSVCEFGEIRFAEGSVLEKKRGTTMVLRKLIGAQWLLKGSKSHKKWRGHGFVQCPETSLVMAKKKGEETDQWGRGGSETRWEEGTPERASTCY